MSNHYMNIQGNYSRTVVVGDIHGCFDELTQLLDLVRFSKEDILVSVGDMLDRGPKSWEVCRYFRDTPNAFSVIGNHERRVLGTIHGTSQLAWSQRYSLSMLTEDEKTQWAEYLETLPAVIETKHVIITHARLNPVTPLDKQNPYFTCAVGGSVVRIDTDNHGVPVWLNQINLEKPVCIGHIGYQKVELVTDKLYALDTTAVTGNKLTCVTFPGGEIFSVDSKQDYYSESYKQWHIRQENEGQDPYQWPLKKIVKLLNNKDGQSEERTVAAKRVINNLAIDQWIENMHVLLKRRFGSVPNPGPIRGEYFKNISQSFPDPQAGLLAGKLAAGKICGVESFMPILKKGTLKKVKQMMNMVEELLKTDE